MAAIGDFSHRANLPSASLPGYPVKTGRAFAAPSSGAAKKCSTCIQEQKFRIQFPPGKSQANFPTALARPNPFHLRAHLQPQNPLRPVMRSWAEGPRRDWMRCRPGRLLPARSRHPQSSRNSSFSRALRYDEAHRFVQAAVRARILFGAALASAARSIRWAKCRPSSMVMLWSLKQQRSAPILPTCFQRLTSRRRRVIVCVDRIVADCSLPRL